MKKVLIFGAGKIGRGFIGQLFHQSGWSIYLFDVVPAVIDLLNKEKKYRVEVSSAPPTIEYVPVVAAYGPSDKENIQQLLNEIDIMVTSVGANNIASTVEFVKPLLRNRKQGTPLNWLICENADKPAEQIRTLLMKDADDSFEKFVTNNLGLVETQILRTGMPADPDVLAKEPLAVRMQNWWTLPLDKDAFKGQIPAIKGFQPKSHFANELQRKVYTFNGTNGPISYVGWMNGFRILHEAALAPQMQEFLKKIQEESAHGLVHEFSLDPAEHKEFQKLAMQKYTDPSINDQIERNARDSKRKLAPRERLVGPASLCIKHGKQPEAYAIAIAAAYAYDGSSDDSTKEVQKTIKESGIESALEKFSGIKKNDPLCKLVVDAYNHKKYILK